jgi:hypothetical protein
MADKGPRDFEWVQARASCSPPKVFELLRAQVISDVVLRNKLSEGQGYKFGTHSESTAFAIFLETMFSRESP